MSVKEKTVVETVMNYKEMQNRVPGSSILREVEWQYADMADGGDGGLGNGKKSIREEYYPGKLDSFFQEVRDLMNWI